MLAMLAMVEDHGGAPVTAYVVERDGEVVATLLHAEKITWTGAGKPERCREMWGDDEKWITRWPEMCRQQLQRLVGAGRNWQQVASTEPIDAY